MHVGRGRDRLKQYDSWSRAGFKSPPVHLRRMFSPLYFTVQGCTVQSGPVFCCAKIRSKAYNIDNKARRSLCVLLIAKYAYKRII